MTPETTVLTRSRSLIPRLDLWPADFPLLLPHLYRGLESISLCLMSFQIGAAGIDVPRSLAAIVKAVRVASSAGKKHSIRSSCSVTS